jgi:hypothetical protein
MKGISKFFRVLYSQILRVVTQPWYWICAAATGIILLLEMIGCDDNYKYFFEYGTEFSLLSYSFLSRLDSFWGFLAFCFCSFPVTNLYIQDYRNNRLSSILTRQSTGNYAAVQIIVTVLGTAACMFLGSVIFMALGHWGLHLSWVREGSEVFVDGLLLESGHKFAFWLTTQIQFCMMAAFCGLCSLLVSILIKDSQFVIVFPMIVQYFLMFFLKNGIITWLPSAIAPGNVYMYNNGLFLGDEIKQCLYSVAYTIIAAAVAGILFYAGLRRQKGR